MRRKRRVLLIRNNAIDAYGGGELYQIMLAKQLIKFDIEPIILSSCKKLRSRANTEGYVAKKALYCRIQNWSGIRNFLLPFYYIWQLLLFFYYCYIYITLRPSVVNIQSRDDMIAATLAAKICRIRVLWTDHADFRNWTMMNVDKKFKNVIGKTILKLTKIPFGIILISNTDGNFFKSITKNLKLKNIFIIQNGVEDSYEPTPKIIKDFYFVGRVTKEKGIYELVSAFNEVSRNNPEIKLHIFGDGEDLVDIQKNANKKIIFHGYKENIAKHVANYQYYVLPSYQEGLSLSLLEACMMKKTIIATDVGGNTEVIDGRNGLLIPAKDSNALKNAMEAILNDEKLSAKMAKNARNTYEKNFNFDKIFKEKMLTLYDYK